MIKKLTFVILAWLGLMAAGCVEINGGPGEGSNDQPVTVEDKIPADLESLEGATGTLQFTEVNSRRVTLYALPLPATGITVPTGLYDVEGNLRCPGGETLRALSQQVEVKSATTLALNWFMYNVNNSLVFSEIYFTGSPNATQTGGLRDTYLRIYNNSDNVVYADGLGIAESCFINSATNTYEILTPANDRSVNFTAGAVWVIPGSGKDVPIQPGESIKIVDQGINWGSEVAGALDHTDADYEWYDDNYQDLDAPATPNLDKWYCYSLSIWLPSNQCNRSYVLVRFPEGMTSEQWLKDYYGKYEYISTLGSQMTNEKAYLIPNSWVIDGVNLGNAETYVRGAVSESIDMGYACISEANRDPARFGKVLRRRVETTLDDGRVILRDTDNSSSDFEVAEVAK